LTKAGVDLVRVTAVAETAKEAAMENIYCHSIQNQRSTDTLEFQTSLRSKIVGQDKACKHCRSLSGLLRRPEFSGARWEICCSWSNGSGKTRIVKRLPEILFGEHGLD